MKILFFTVTVLFVNLAFAADTLVMSPTGEAITVAVSEPTPVDNSLIGLVVAIVFGLNALLFGLYNALGYVKDRTSTQLDNKLYALLATALGWLQKIIEVVGPVSTVKAVSKDVTKPT